MVAFQSLFHGCSFRHTAFPRVQAISIVFPQYQKSSVPLSLKQPKKFWCSSEFSFLVRTKRILWGVSPGILPRSKVLRKSTLNMFGEVERSPWDCQQVPCRGNLHCDGGSSLFELCHLDEESPFQILCFCHCTNPFPMPVLAAYFCRRLYYPCTPVTLLHYTYIVLLFFSSVFFYYYFKHRFILIQLVPRIESISSNSSYGFKYHLAYWRCLIITLSL